MPSIQNEIRENLERMGVNGLSVDIRYDAKSNTAIVRFCFKGKNYEMKINNQRDVRCSMYAISRRIEYKARMHLLEIEPFELSVSPYLQLENQSGIRENTYTEPTKASAAAYALFGVQEYSSNDEITKAYKKLARAYHPDNCLNEESKAEFERKMAEINQAYGEIKKERGL